MGFPGFNYNSDVNWGGDWRPDKHHQIISQVFALVSESSHADTDNTEWTSQYCSQESVVGRERKVNFQARMKIFRLMINIMMYQDTGTSIIQTLLT